MTKAEWSGWVQSIGAIFAILAAGGIATYQMTHTRRIENEKRVAIEVQRLNNVLALAVRCYSLSREVVAAIDDPQPATMDVVAPGLMRDTGEILLALPYFDIPGGIAALDVITLGRTISNLAVVWDQMCDKAQQQRRAPSAEEQEEVRSFADEISRLSDEAIKHSKREIRLRGGILN